MSNVLYDSGAITSSYISHNFVESNRELLSPFLSKIDGRVKLGDNETIVAVIEELTVTVAFVDLDGTEYSAAVKFPVFPMSHLDMIIGLPQILGPFFTFFFKLLEDSRGGIVDASEFDLCNLVEGEVIYPWSAPLEEIAPEEETIPLPSANSFAIHYLTMSVEDARQEFLDQFSTQVNRDMAKQCPKVFDLLREYMHVFVPTQWNGINGFDDIELEFSPDMPNSIKPPARYYNPRLMELAKSEFDRLCSYHYVPSTSPWCSPLVIASKATAPYMRFAVDCKANKYIRTMHTPIPNPQEAIVKMTGYKFFLDIDLKNAFHQFRLAEHTSNVLSVQTPWGQVRPIFMPEGITPASAILQKAVASIFTDFDDCGVIIFDNILIGCHSYEDAYEKLKRLLLRCSDRNVILKFIKTFIGNDWAVFFGYLISQGSWKITPERIESIRNIPTPNTKKRLQSLLGAALFTRNFIPNFSKLTAPLHNFCKDGVKWNPELVSEIEKFCQPLKDAIAHAFTLFFPDLDLPWFLQADASAFAVASILFQERTREDGTKEKEPLFFHSHKLSDQAQRWDTHKRECWALVCAFKDNESLLRGKLVYVDTDHANLLAMEIHTAPIVIRWRIYLQSFHFMLRHIKGKDNVFADFGSRMLNHILMRLDYQSSEDTLDQWRQFSELLENSPFVHLLNNTLGPISSPEVSPSIEAIFKSVHGGKVGHWGVRSTWKLLNKIYPGHGMSMKVIADFISACPICQKNRLGMQDRLTAVVRHLHQSGPRDTISMDLLTVTPRDDRGNQYILVVINLFSKLVALYAVADKEAETTASCLVQYFATYGICSNLHSDPGSDYTSEVVKELVKCYGVTQSFTIVNSPKANGVENSNQNILRHLRAMVMDLRANHFWSHPMILSILAFHLNSFDNSEVGVIPFEATFGSEALTHMVLPTIENATTDFVRKLNEDLKLIQDRSIEYQQALVKSKTALNPDKRNTFQPGDYVLFDHLHDGSLREFKLKHRYLGPFRVISHTENDVQCRHLVEDTVSIFDVLNLKPFFGTDDQALEAALIDYNRFVVKAILGHSGDARLRSKCDFEVEYESKVRLWLPYNHREVGSLVVFESYCRAHSDLFPLLYSAADAAKEVASLSKIVINNYAVKDTIFLNLRFFGAQWYSDKKLLLPDKLQSTYRVKSTVCSLLQNSKLMEINIPVFKLRYQLNGYDIKAFVSKELTKEDILFDAAWLKKLPYVLKSLPK